MTDPTNGSVSFTIKELLARQDVKLDTIIVEIRNKADRTDLDRLTGRVEALERGAAVSSSTSSLTRWVVPVLISLASVGMSILVLMTR